MERLLHGKVTETQYSYQKKAMLYPTAHYYGDVAGKPYIKYGCPICESLGFKHQVHPTDDNCPNCGVNLDWSKTVEAALKAQDGERND